VLLGGVGVDGGWGLDLSGPPSNGGGDRNNNNGQVSGPTGNCCDWGAVSFSWASDGTAQKGSNAKFQGTNFFALSTDSSPPPGINPHLGSGPTIYSGNPNPSDSTCNSDSDCKHYQSCPNNQSMVCLNDSCSCPLGDIPSDESDPRNSGPLITNDEGEISAGPGGADSGQPDESTDSSEPTLRACPPGGCRKPPKKKDPPSGGGCSNVCCPGKPELPDNGCALMLVDCSGCK